MGEIKRGALFGDRPNIDGVMRLDCETTNICGFQVDVDIIVLGAQRRLALVDRLNVETLGIVARIGPLSLRRPGNAEEYTGFHCKQCTALAASGVPGRISQNFRQGCSQ